MKKNIIIIILLWVGLVFFAVSGILTPDRQYMVEINRIHENDAQDIIKDRKPSLPETSRIQSIKAVNRKNLPQEQARIFFSGSDIPDSLFYIYPVDRTDYFIRYEIKTNHGGKPLQIILLSVIPLFVLFLLFRLEKNTMKPLTAMASFPEQLSKGNYIFTAKQYKNKQIHKFLWGLDMMRIKLDEQKDINLRLEKDRKTLVASLTHDIKTPLSSIRVYTAAIKDGTYQSQEEIQDALDIIWNKTETINLLTDELLYSSINALEEMQVNVSEHYLEELRQTIDKVIHSKIDLLKMNYQIESIDANYLIRADMDRLTEACGNIIENSIKYGDLGDLFVSFRNEEQHLLISFENSGKHIPDTEIKHVFTSFYRGSNVDREKGHGLGLYIVKKIMKAMGGDAFAENTKIGVKIVLVLKI